MARLTVALAGNPNSGKTTLFNRLTGARQKVGNYPGVTVELMEGTHRHAGGEMRVVDLPGTYSLSTLSDEELVARDYLMTRRPDVVVDVVDASNLARNLYLTTDLVELGLPLVIVLNMSDVARKHGHVIDTEALGRRLGAPVVAVVGTTGEGLDDVVAAVEDVALGRNGYRPRPVVLADDVEDRLRRLEALVDTGLPTDLRVSRRWLALKLLEKDERVAGLITNPGQRERAVAIARELDRDPDTPSDVVLAQRRYEAIAALCRDTVRREERAGGENIRTDRIDRIAMHPVWGVPVFLVLMFVVFHLTFTLGNPLMQLMELGVGRLTGALAGLWSPGSTSPLKSLVIDGILGGVGGVLVFLPNIVLLFLAIALLEGTGYMARAAFVMDRFMSRVGLHGKSFIPLLIGFGCTVPAIMATRTLETRRDRLITMMVLPLMSCGARLPIYALIIPAFFPQIWQGPVLWVIYLTGIVLAMVGVKFLRGTMFRGETTPFLMELPPYRMPTVGSLLSQMWHRAWLYLKKAGTVILGLSIILWFLTSYPKPPPEVAATNPPTGPAASAETHAPDALAELEAQAQAQAMSHSAAGRIGRFLEPALKPLGFDWRIGTAMIGAFAAKEMFVAQMGIIFSVGEADENSEALRSQLQRHYSPLVGFCIMLFALIATPCMATVTVTRQESGSWRWALAQFWGLTLLAWVVTALVYQVGSRLVA